MIFACARTKLAVVAADERDGGRRQVLNLGHTVGHAIETATGYARYRHGEAVGLGLLAALRLSGQDELREQVRELLRGARAAGARSTGSSVDAVLEAIAPRQEAPGRRACRSCSSARPARSSSAARSRPRSCAAAVRGARAMSAPSATASR